MRPLPAPRSFALTPLAAFVGLGAVCALAVACRRPTAPGSDPASSPTSSVAPPPGERRPSASAEGAQGWTDAEQSRFFHQGVGSDPFPLFVLSELRQPDGRRFLEDLARFGLLPDPSHDQNEERLPVGMTVYLPQDLQHFNVRFYGLTCAACHVGELSALGRTVRLPGAPGRFDLGRFQRELVAAAQPLLEGLPATRRVMLEFYDEVTRASEDMTDPTGLKRVLIQASLEPGPEERAAPFLASLRGDLEAQRRRVRALTAEQVARQDPLLGPAAEPRGRPVLAAATTVRLARSGEGGVPAGMLELAAEERVAVVNGLLSDFYDVLRLLRARLQAADAAASAPQRAGPGRVDALAALRVLGQGERRLRLDPARTPFAPVAPPALWRTADLPRLHWDNGVTSVLEHGLMQALALGAAWHPARHATSFRPQDFQEVQRLLGKLQPPRWPWLPAPDAALVEVGRVLFGRHCARCHQPGEAGYAVHPEVGTDGARLAAFRSLLGGRPTAERLGTVVAGAAAAARARLELSEQAWAHLTGGRPQRAWSPAPGYAARGLAGIWASAPYLHNDSVPTLADLLELDLEGEARRPRPTAFNFRPGAYDPRRVGVAVGTGEGPVGGPDHVEIDSRQPGNGNGGHRYGSELTRAEKTALLEYLKSL